MWYNYYNSTGCIRISSNMLMQQVLRQPKTKVMIGVRELTDRFYAAYNYWCRYYNYYDS